VTYGHKARLRGTARETCAQENSFQVVTAVNVNAPTRATSTRSKPVLEQIERTCWQGPEELDADSGYASARNIVLAETAWKLSWGADRVERTRVADALEDFELDESGERVVQCPMGQQPVEHRPSGGGKRCWCASMLGVQEMLLRDICLTNRRRQYRVLRLTPEDVAVARRRIEQETSAFKSGTRCDPGSKPRIRS